MSADRHAWPLVLAAFLLVAAPSGAFSSPTVTTLPGFEAELNRLLTEIAAAGSEQAPAIAATLPDVWQVDARGQQIDVSTKWLASALRDTPKSAQAWSGVRSAIVARLGSIRDQAALLERDDRADARARARSTVASILAREEFRQSAASRWREELQRRIGEWLERIFSRFGVTDLANRTTAMVLAWAAALIALAGLGSWLARMITVQRRGAALNLGAAGMKKIRARELALKALEAARAGNGRDAVRFGYQAALISLEEQGAWRVDESRTPREYLRMLRSSDATDARHALMLDLTKRFEQIWYGNRTVMPDDTPHVTAHLETLGCLRPGERAI